MKHRARKRFGQNFLTDDSIIHKIIQSIQPQPTDNLIEIGPGLGSLTVALLPYLNQLRAIEIDRDLQAYLLQRLNLEKFHLIKADALAIDYSQLGTALRIVGNLPYNISTTLLLHLLKFIPNIEDMYFMLQKEVVDRITALPGTKDFGRLTVMLKYHCEINYLFTVPAEAFEPIPKVTSAMVQLIPHPNLAVDADFVRRLEKLVAKAFGMRRKTLNNNLKSIITEEQFKQLNIDASKRPEEISINEYVQLAKLIHN